MVSSVTLDSASGAERFRKIDTTAIEGARTIGPAEDSATGAVALATALERAGIQEENVRALSTTCSVIIPLVSARASVSALAPSPSKSPASVFGSCVLTGSTHGLINLQVVLHACAAFAACVAF